MVKVFRRFRAPQFSDGASRYFKYALGEIVLLVVGILIALQVNSWNQERVDRASELRYLQDLHQEFSANKALLVDSLKAKRDAMQKIDAFLGKL